MKKSIVKSKAPIDDCNHDILNLITPSGLEFLKTKSIIGDNFAKSMIITRYPTNPDYGWLSKITNIPGVTASLEFQPTDSGALIERCNEQIRQYRVDLGSIKEESEIQRKEKIIDDITSMIKRINEDSEVVGYLNIVLLCQATTEKLLEERVKRLCSITSSFGLYCRNLTFLQKDAYKCIAPYGMPISKISSVGERNIPISTFCGGFPNSSSGINDGKGYFLGRTIHTDKLTILDTWKRGNDRTNSNWAIFGNPGIGKSATVKDIAIKEYALGAKLIFIDPEQEYIELVENLGGAVIDCGGGNGKINPLQIRVSPKPISDDGEEEDEDESSVNDMALYFQSLRTFFKMYLGNITSIQLAKLEECLEELYNNFGITWETDISKLKPTDFPIMENLYNLIGDKISESPSDDDYLTLHALLRSASVGADSFLWNGYTNIDTAAKADVIDLNIASLLEADDKIQKAQYYNILSWAWQRMAVDRNERIILFVDEAYLIVDPDTPQALIFMRNVSKRIRKYEGALVVITHSVVDLLDPSVKRYGQAIIDNACYKFIMGTDGKNLEETKKLFRLTENEVSLLRAGQRGQGILFAGSRRIAIQIDIPAEFLALMGKSGGR